MGVGSEQQTASAPAAVRACHILSGSLCFQAPISRSQSLAGLEGLNSTRYSGKAVPILLQNPLPYHH